MRREVKCRVKSLNLFYPTLLYSTPFYSTPCCSIPSYSTLYSTSFYSTYLLIHSSLLFDFSLQFASFSLICSFLKYIIGEAQKRISCHDCLLLSHYDILFLSFLQLSDVPIMLVAGKDSFHKSFYNLMVEGNRSKTYNTNESQDETEDLIKGKGRVVLMNVVEKEKK